jgi:hypothetical protein
LPRSFSSKTSVKGLRATTMAVSFGEADALASLPSPPPPQPANASIAVLHRAAESSRRFGTSII